MSEETKYKLVSAFSGAMFCYVVIALAFGMITQGLKEAQAFKDSNAYILLNYLLVGVSLVLGCAYALLKNKTLPQHAVSFKLDGRFVIVIVLVFVGSYFALSKLNDAFVSIFTRFGYIPDELRLPTKTPLNVILTILTVAVIPAVCEEFLFRGLVLNSAKWLGDVKSVLISAGFFCIYHMSPYQTAYQFVMGVLYGIVALKANSVLPTVIMHFLNNLLVILWYYFFPSFEIQGAWLIVTTVLGAIAIVVAVLLCFKFNKEKQAPLKLEKWQKVDFGVNLLPGVVLCLFVWISNLFM